MASRRFFGYDPYDYYYTTASPYHYPHPYYSLHQQPAPARRAGTFFPVVADGDEYYYGYNPEPAVARNAGGFVPSIGELDPYYRPAPARRAAKVESRSDAGAARPVSSIPVHFASEPKPEPEPEDAIRVPVNRAPSAEEAAVRLQAAARGFLVRRAVRALRAVEREAEEIGARVAREAEALRGDGRARVAVGEQLMRLLFRLDTVRGARGYRKRVAKRVLALQDAVDALEQRTVEEEGAEVAGEMQAAEVEEDGEVDGNAAAETVVQMEVDGDRVAAEETEPAVVDGTNLGADKSADEDAAGEEWEMVAEAEEPSAAVPADPESPAEQRQDVAEETTTTRPAEAGSGDLDTNKLMEMVAALCEQSTQQCAAIGALADRVDALERVVRRVEDAERRRRRGKKLRKEGKGSNHVSKCYSD